MRTFPLPETKDIFDITVSDDLPFSVAKKPTQEDTILELHFKAGRALNVKELRAGYFRTYGKDITEGQLSTATSRLTSRGLLKRIKNGTFEITKP